MGNPESKPLKTELTTSRQTSRSVSSLSSLEGVKNPKKLESLLSRRRGTCNEESVLKLKTFERTSLLKKLDKKLLNIVSYINTTFINDNLSKDVSLDFFTGCNLVVPSVNEENMGKTTENIKYFNSYYDISEKRFKLFGLKSNKFDFKIFDQDNETNDNNSSVKVIKLPLNKENKRINSLVINTNNTSSPKDTSNIRSPDRSPVSTRASNYTTQESENSLKVFSKKIIPGSTKSSFISNSNTSYSNMTAGTEPNASRQINNIPMSRVGKSSNSPKRKSKSKSKERIIIKMNLKDIKELSKTQVEEEGSVNDSFSQHAYNTSHIYNKKKISISEAPKTIESPYSTTNSHSKIIEYNMTANNIARDRSPATNQKTSYVGKLRQKNDYKIIQDQKEEKKKLEKVNKTIIVEDNAQYKKDYSITGDDFGAHKDKPINNNNLVYRKANLNNTFSGDFNTKPESNNNIKATNNVKVTTTINNNITKQNPKGDGNLFEKFNEQYNEKFSKNNNNKILFTKLEKINEKNKSPSPVRNDKNKLSHKQSFVETEKEVKKDTKNIKTGNFKINNNIIATKPIDYKKPKEEEINKPVKEPTNYWVKMKTKEIQEQPAERNKSAEPKKIVKINLLDLTDDGNIFETIPSNIKEDNKAKLNKIKNKPSINGSLNDQRSKTPTKPGNKDFLSLEGYLYENDRASVKRGTPKFEKRTTFGKVDDYTLDSGNDFPTRFSFNMLLKKVSIYILFLEK
jgi:hypothetical protein